MDNKVRRLGVIVPPGNVAVEREFPLFLPKGVVLNHGRLSRPDSIQSRESILAINARLEQVAVDLAQTYPEVIAYACTGATFLEGPGREAVPVERIAKATGIPAVGTSPAVVAALRSFGARRVVLVAPYPEDIMEHEVRFLTHHGFEVPLWDTFRCATSEANRAVSSEQVAEKVLGHRAAIAGSDAVFISCTNLLAMDQIETLEAALGKPVVTSNQATLWAALGRMELDMRGLGGGRLFESAGAGGRRVA